MRINGIVTAAKMGLQAPKVQNVPEFMQTANSPKINQQLKQNTGHYPRIYGSAK